MERPDPDGEGIRRRACRNKSFGNGLPASLTTLKPPDRVPAGSLALPCPGD